MKKIQERIMTQISKLKREIIDLTNEIETVRNEDATDIGISSEMQDRLKILNEKLLSLSKNLEIYKSSKKSSTVSIGNTVYISNSNISEKELTIVLPEDADTNYGYISAESPLGKALLEKKEGEKIDINTPSGKQSYTVSKIKREED